MNMDLVRDSTSFGQLSGGGGEDEGEAASLEAMALDEEPKPMSFKLEIPPLTARYYLDFQRVHSIEISERQFVGICAYLYTLLHWNYKIDADQLDLFITYYETFTAWLPYLEDQQLSSTRPQIPSYHQWFDQEMKRNAECRSKEEDHRTEAILTKQTLESVQEENPLIFLRTRLSMECMVIDVERDNEEAALIRLLQT